MTTIAYRNGVMAGDSATSCDEAMSPGVAKVRRLKGGWVVGFAGSLMFIDHVMQAIEKGLGRGAPSPTLLDLSDLLAGEGDDKDDVTLLMAHKVHGVYSAEVSGMKHLMAAQLDETRYYAIGTGAKIALGRMHGGGGAKHAVQAAIVHDNSTGGPITVVEV